MEELQRMRRHERLDSQILREREARRERSPQEVRREGESMDVREEEFGMNLGGEREYSALITEEIRNPTKEIVPVEANEPPRSKKIAPKLVAPAPNHLYPKCLSYKW